MADDLRGRILGGLRNVSRSSSATLEQLGKIRSHEDQLTSKGFLKIDDPKADLTLTYQVAVDRERQWNAFGSGGIRWGGGMGTATSTTIPIGAIVLDFYDPNKKGLVWQGRATKAIDPKSTQEKQQKALDGAIKKLLKNFPPTPKKK